MSIRSIGSTLLLGAAALAGSGHAQITVDGSLTGSARDVTGDANATYAITEDFGARAGSNLFYSFGTFEVLPGEVAEFRPDATITENVIGRITDPAGALVNGTLRSTGDGVNLWLISPAGWTFGAGAAIDVPATLHLSTASNVDFDDGSSFTATSAVASSLTVAAPVSFGFLQAQPAAIEMTGTTISRSTRGLALSAGDITLTDTQVGTAFAPAAAEIQMTTVGGVGTVDATTYDTDARGGSIRMVGSELFLFGDDLNMLSAQTDRFEMEGSRVEALGVGPSGNQIRVQAGSIDIDAGSAVRSGVAPAAFGGRGVNIELAADGDLVIAGALQSAARAIDSTAGDIVLSGTNIRFEGAQIDTSRAVPGPAGAFNATATNAISAQDASFRNVTNFGAGAVMQFQAPTITLSNTFVQADTQDTAQGPGILFQADDLTLDQGSVITADVERGSGAGLTFEISNRLTVTDSSLITTESFDDATGAPINITAGSVDLTDQGRITSDVVLSGSGGTITLDVGTLNISGNGDDTGIFARAGTFSFDPTQIGVFLDDPLFGTGNGGDIRISADTVRIQGGAISVDTFGSGNAGNVRIELTGLLELDGTLAPATLSSSATALYDTIGPDALGGGGTLTIIADAVQLAGDAQVRSDTDSNQQPGGAISLRAGRVNINGDPATAPAVIAALDAGASVAAGFTGIASNSDGAARGGSIDILAGNLQLAAGIISASGTGTGGGGDIRIGEALQPAGFVLADGASGVLARAQQGNGGNIFLFADQFLSDVNTVISADSNLGNAGTVSVYAPELDISAALNELNVPNLDAADLIRDACTAEQLENVSSLVVEDQQSVAPAPDAHLHGWGTPAPPQASLWRANCGSGAGR